MISHFSYDKEAQDQDIRVRAIDVEKSFIVQAPAGSGKTELLVSRFINLLAYVNEPEEIVAITFTRKAADEMTVRVIERLQLARSAPHKLTKENYDICVKALQRDEQKNWNILDNTQRLSIQTIDSFCLKIASQLPWTTGLGDTPSVTDDASSIYQQAVNQTLNMVFDNRAQQLLDSEQAAELEKAVQMLLSQHNYNFAKCQKNIVNLLSTRDQWLSIIYQYQDYAQAREAMDSLWQDLILKEIKALDYAISEFLNKEVIAAFVYAGNCLVSEYGENAEKKHAIAIFANDNTQPTASLVDKNKWQAIAHFLLTQKDTPRVQLNKTIGLPAVAESDPFKASIKSLCEILNDNPDIVEKLAKVKTLPPSHYDEDSWQQITAIYSVLKLSAANLLLVFKANNPVDHSEITSRVLEALANVENNSAHNNLALKLDYKIQHILIDEFQDTSASQLDLLLALTQEWHQGDKRSLFLVGDPMQSIYRFRAANVVGFISIFKHGLPNIHLNPLKLTTNFRSAANIVDWVNEHFQHMLPDEKSINEFDEQLGAVKYTQSQAFHNHQQDAYVQCHIINAPRISNEADTVVKLVQQSIDDNVKSIAILTRSRDYVREIIIALSSANISNSNIKINPINQIPCVLDIASLTKALLHLADDIAWTSLLRAPWCGLSIEEIQQIFQSSNAHLNSLETVWQRLKFAQMNKVLDDNAMLRLNHLINSIEPFIDQYDLKLHEKVSCCWQQLYDITNHTQVLSAQELDNIDLFLRQLCLQELAGKIEDVKDIDDFMDGLYAIENKSHTNESGHMTKIEVMTIHNSKGLQFEHVIIPGLSRGKTQSNENLLLWFSYINSDNIRIKGNLVTGFNDSKNVNAVSRRNFIKEVQQAANIYEQSRLLYVACTRAEKKLDLLFYDKKPAAGTPAKLFEKAFTKVPCSQEYLENMPADIRSSTEETRLNVNNRLARLSLEYISHIKPSLDSSLTTKENVKQDIPFQWAGLEARLVGTLIHDYLCDISHVNLESANKALTDIAEHYLSYWQKSAITNGIVGNNITTFVSDMEKRIKSLANDEKLQWILFDHPQAKSEWSLIYKEAQQSNTMRPLSFKKIIIDRSFVDKSTRWIVDYKTGVHQGGDLDLFLANEQLRYEAIMHNYAKAVNAYDNNKYPIKIGLYFPMIRAWREWDFMP